MANFSNKVLNNFVGGEVSPKMYDRSDLPQYQKSLAKCQNFITFIQGGARFRPGFQLVHQTKQNKLAWLIPFQFSDQQAYIIEATDQTFRFYSNNGVIFAGTAIVEKMLNSDPVTIYSTAHGFSVNQRVHVAGATGLTALNNNDYLINSVPNANQFTLKSLAGVIVDARHMGAYKGGGTVTLVATLSGVTNANPGVFTSSAAHGLTVGQEIQITGIVGMTNINSRFFRVNTTPTATTFTLTDLQGNVIDTTASGAYVSGGSFAAIYEVTTPYLEADISTLQFTQNANTMYIVHQNYEPRKLTRSSAASFALAPFTRTGTDPFPPASPTKWPRAVAFINGARLAYGDTILNPETFWASAAPTTSNTAFDNFTTSGTPTATDSVIFTLTPFLGKADTIEWISSTDQFGVIGCFGSLRTLYGASQTQAISPLGITSLPINNFGCAQVAPISIGESLFYVQRGNQILRTIIYDFTSNGYRTKDLTLVADHLTVTGIAQIVYQNGIPDAIWSVRGDGKMLGLTYKLDENVSSWHQHMLGGQAVNANGLINNYATLLSLGVMPRENLTDQLWASVERVINGVTIRSIEFMSDQPIYPLEHDFYTGEADRTLDLTKYQNSMYETNKYACHLDLANLYDGAQQAPNIALTPAATTGTGIVVTASVAYFTTAMVGRQLWKQYDLNGNGGGRCTIVGFTDSTHVLVNVLSPFDNTNQWGPGNWLITTASISGLDYAEGATVNVVTDGGVHADCLVTAGTITLDTQHSVVWAGFGYTGILEALNIDSGGQFGTASAKKRTVREAVVWFANTVSAWIGTKYYGLQKTDLHLAPNIMGRPTLPYNGQKRITMFDSWTENKKIVLIVQNQPLPCTILGIDAFMATVDEAD